MFAKDSEKYKICKVGEWNCEKVLKMDKINRAPMRKYCTAVSGTNTLISISNWWY